MTKLLFLAVSLYRPIWWPKGPNRESAYCLVASDMCIEVVRPVAPHEQNGYREYATYQEYFAKRWGLTDLPEACPLLLGRNFLLRTGNVNYLLPPEHMRRTVGSSTLRAHAPEVTALLTTFGVELPAHLPACAQGEEDGQAVLGRWEGRQEDRKDGRSWPLLPLLLCQVHSMPVSALRQLQYLPSLLYRLEVCTSNYPSTSPAQLKCGPTARHASALSLPAV